LSSQCRCIAGQDQLPPALDEPDGLALDEPDGAGVEAGAAPDAPAVNELTEAVTSLPFGATSHHLAPNESLPCPVAMPGPESPAKKYSGCPS
jgi:hypothetical protein